MQNPVKSTLESVKFRLTDRTGRFFHAATKTHDWPSGDEIQKLDHSVLNTL